MPKTISAARSNASSFFMLIPPSNFFCFPHGRPAEASEIFSVILIILQKAGKKQERNLVKKVSFFLAGICGFCGKYQKTAPLSERGRFNLYHANTMDQLPKLGQYRTNARMCIGRGSHFVKTNRIAPCFGSRSTLIQVARQGLSVRIRFANANMILNLALCFSSPRYRVFRKRSCFLTTPNTCSTFARTEDFACSAFFAAYWPLFAQFLHLGWPAIDSVFDFAASLVADDRIIMFSRTEITAITVNDLFFSGQQL